MTTKQKKQVYFDRYTPVDGEIGEEGPFYQLEISMNSNAIEPDDVLHDYTGILK